MGSCARQRFLQVLGGVCATCGFLAWMGLAWTALADPDRVTPQSETGGRLVGWGVTGTVLMIFGLLFLQLAAGAEKDGESDEPTPPR